MEGMAPCVVAERPARTRDPRVVFVAAAGAAAWLMLASVVSTLVDAGRLGALGAAAPFGWSVPFFVSSALAVTAAMLLRTNVPSDTHRVARRVLCVGAWLGLLSACFGVAESAAFARGVSIPPAVVTDLFEVATVLGIVSYWCYAAAAFRFAARGAAPTRRGLRALGWGVVAGSLGSCYSLASIEALVHPGFEQSVFATGIPTLVQWFAVAWGLLAIARSRDVRTAACLELGAVAAGLLSLAMACTLLADAVGLSHPVATALQLARLGAAVGCVAWALATGCLLLATLIGADREGRWLWVRVDRRIRHVVARSQAAP